MPDYTYVDQPFLLQQLFFPRRDFNHCPPHGFDMMAEVDDGVNILRFYAGETEWPWILYFHGNGEVVSDYDFVAGMYHEQQINLVVADYRGYGISSGIPSFAALIRDAHTLYLQVRQELAARHYSRQLFVMGRSLGSISALELAFHYQHEIAGLIIESGFASINRLIVHLGMMETNRELEKIEEQCMEMIRDINVPALVLHGQWDQLVLPAEGYCVLQTLGSLQKDLVLIEQAGHNDIIIRDFNRYFGAIRNFVYPSD